LLAWLEEEDEDNDNGRFSHQLNGEGFCCRDHCLPQPAIYRNNTLDEAICCLS
jgi:hypothetical protein